MIHLDATYVHDIVTHMNGDHADAILAWTRAFGGLPDATAARMLDIDADGTNVECDTAGGAVKLRIAFEPPIESIEAVRRRLVILTREARSALDSAG